MEPDHFILMSLSSSPAALDALRRQVRALETQDRTTRAVLPFGVPARADGGSLAPDATDPPLGWTENANGGLLARSGGRAHGNAGQNADRESDRRAEGRFV